MEFLKKHYEKVLLGVVLLGLTIAFALLPFILGSKRAKLTEISNTLLRPKIKELPALDMTTLDAALQHVETPVQYDFTRDHNLFNPVLWQKTPDGHLKKVPVGRELAGPEVMEVTAITPLYLRLSFHSPSADGFLIGVEQQAATRPDKRSEHETFAMKDTKNDIFTLRDVKAIPDKPVVLVLELNENGEEVTIDTNKPYERIDGYAADLKYPPENRVWKGVRRDTPLTLGGAQYKIVAITETNVVVSANSNEKKTTINFNAVTETR